MFRSSFFLPTTHEVGTASAAQVDRSHDVSPLLGAEVSEAHPKRVGREGGLALRTNPSGTRPATVRIRLGSPSPRRTTKNDSMNVGRVAPARRQDQGFGVKRTHFHWRMEEVSAKHVVRSQTQESHCDKQSEANASCNVDVESHVNVESHVKRQEHTAKRFTGAITRCPTDRTRR